MFRISTYKYLADEQGIGDADDKKVGAHFVSKHRIKEKGPDFTITSAKAVRTGISRML